MTDTLLRDILILAGAVPNPVTVATNVALAGHCAGLAAWMGVHRRRTPLEGRAAPASEVRRWSAFFLLMSGAALAGAAKHGTVGLLEPGTHRLVAVTSNVLVGAAIATLHSVLIPGRSRFRVLWLAAFLGAAVTAAFAASFALTGLASAVGMVPVVAASASDAMARRPGGTAMTSAWCTAAAAGLAWIALPSPVSWLAPVDVAHLILVPALALVALGARTRRVGPAPDPPRPGEPPTCTATSGS